MRRRAVKKPGARMPVTFMYHSVGGKDPRVSVALGLFRQQMRLLRDNCFSCLPSEAAAICSRGGNCGRRSLIITFDDAYEDIYYSAFPILLKYRLKAAVYVNPGYIGKANSWNPRAACRMRHLSESMISKMSSSGLVEFGSHGMTHRNLQGCSPDDLRREVVFSKSRLEKITGSGIVSFAYPYGAWNRRVQSCVRRHYSLAFATDEGGDDWGRDRYALSRIDISRLPVNKMLSWCKG